MIFKANPLIIRFLRNSSLIAMITLLILFSSCVTQRYVEYIQDQNKTSETFSESEFPDYKLKSHDELFIKINSLDEASANVFSNTTQTSQVLDPYSASLLSYTVDKNGNLLLPVIGNIFVKDKTLSEVSLILRDSLYHVLHQPIVTVKLVNRYVSVLGEVQNPGHYAYSQEKITIFDAIGLAGDITDYGNRENVILVRNENGENIRANVRLTTSELLSSKFYYLRPNDILYIKPLQNKFWGMRQFPWTVFFSAITTGLLFYQIIRTN
jgi:polysaccharide export outer membrane protein